jgi:hypothetical protein
MRGLLAQMKHQHRWTWDNRAWQIPGQTPIVYVYKCSVCGTNRDVVFTDAA